MNKKLAMIGTGVAVGSMLLISSVYAGVGDAPGYNAYKSAVKNTAAVDNVTQKVNVSVEDNGKLLFQVNSTLKADKTNQNGSASVTLTSGTTEQSIQFYKQDDKKIIKTSDSETYKILDLDHEQGKFKEYRKHEVQHDPAFAQEVENVIDTLAGNLKNYVILQENGTSKDIQLHLSGSQIPAAVNAVGSLFIKESGRRHNEEMKFNPSDTLGVNVNNIKDSLPQLTSDIKIETVNLDASVNADNLITSQAAVIKITGKDSQGAEHQVNVKLGVGLSDFDSTTPDTVDLTGKQVETVKPPFHEGRSHWNKQ